MERGIRSLGPLTDLMVMEGETEVIERPDYWVLKTPSIPTFYWGNYLLFKKPPSTDSVDEWERSFEQEFQPHAPAHRALAWEHGSPKPPASPQVVLAFTQRGYNYDVCKVLTASKVTPPKHLRTDVEIRPLASDQDWHSQVDLSVATRSPQESLSACQEFALRQARAHRRLIESGTGVWFGAFDGSELLASAGLYWGTASALGRFQTVATAPSARRQGLCGTIVYRLAQLGLSALRLPQLVMVADENYHAARIYESLGFALTERHGELLRRSERPAE